MIARKKPLEVFAIRYNDLIDVESFLKLLNRNKKDSHRGRKPLQYFCTLLTVMFNRNKKDPHGGRKSGKHCMSINRIAQ